MSDRLEVTLKPQELGVIVGRFQTPSLHTGHRALLDTARANHGRVALFLGVAPVVSRKNPLDFASRRAMIYNHYPDLLVVPVPDHPSDEVWSDQLDARIDEIRSPMESVRMYGGRDSFAERYHGAHPYEHIDADDGTSGTSLRQSAARETLWTEDFRRGVMFAIYNDYPRVAPTVDVAIYDDSGRLLVGRKKSDEGYRLVGGFAESTNFEADARREAMEETGLEVDGFEYIGSATIDDWRYAGTEHRIRTVLFAAKRMFGNAVAGDDLHEVRWLDPGEFRMQDACHTHQPLFALLQEKGKL